VLGPWTSLIKSSARDLDEEDAAAARTCWTSCTSRVAGFVSKSFVNAWES
jgi:hypothetical protein